jgi:hypothetical protein
LTESEQKGALEFKEFFYVFQKEQAKIEEIKPSINIPFKGIDTKRRKNVSTNNEVDPIEKKRALKRWKKSFSYYCHHPEKFRFGMKNLK